jgi:hypothetical protein
MLLILILTVIVKENLLLLFIIILKRLVIQEVLPVLAPVHLSSVTLQTTTCFDWIAAYGPDTNDDTVTAALTSFSRYVTISSFSPVSGKFQLFSFCFIILFLIFFRFV